MGEEMNVLDESIEDMLVIEENAVFFGLTRLQMMESAGRSVADVVEKFYGSVNDIAVFCGPGNNGGDGLVASRYLSRKNHVDVYFVGDRRHIKKDECKKNYDLLSLTNYARLIHIRSVKDVDKIQGDYTVVVDALLGTGVKGELKEPFRSVVNRMNQLSGHKVSVDLPTPGFKPDITISFHLPKVKNALVAQIGIPAVINIYIGPGDVLLLNKKRNKVKVGTDPKGDEVVILDEKGVDVERITSNKDRVFLIKNRDGTVNVISGDRFKILPFEVKDLEIKRFQSIINRFTARDRFKQVCGVLFLYYLQGLLGDESDVLSPYKLCVNHELPPIGLE